MEQQEKIDLLNKAKEKYYNTGEEILTDAEYDALEEELGLENKNYVGSKSVNYTIKHPFIMGSLSKVQVKSIDGVIDWAQCFENAKKYFNRNGNNIPLIITPKYDGCSFEAIIENGKIVSISTRGDGEYGKDIYKHISNLITPQPNYKYTLRGEVLIDKNKFNNTRFKEQFSNPRSFVSGLLNRDYDENDKEFMEMITLLEIVIYDIRIFENGFYIDHDWTNYKHLIKHTPSLYYDKHLLTNELEFKEVYYWFDEYRRNSQYALDGFVIKPVETYRENNLTNIRPKDCVAIKFLPMIQETEVVDIEWSLSKTNELRPVIIVNPVEMDGKMISRATAHNYGYLLDNKISIGTKVQLSLAGDIIPYIFKVTDTSAFNENKLNLPNVDYYKDGCHLFQNLSQTELMKKKFLSSAAVLQIPHVGPSTAEAIYNIFKDNIWTCHNILNIMDDFYLKQIYEGLGGGKSAQNVIDSIKEYRKKITLVDIIKSMCIPSCGEVASNLCARIMSGLPYDTTGINYEAYEWVFTGYDRYIVEMYREQLNVPYLKEEKKNNDRIPVILTGKPSECTNYNTKTEWLNAHPQYIETTKFNECKILFTGDINSNSSKIKKAQKLNIEIKLYED